MSKLTEQLRLIGIYNAHGFADHGNVYISYSPRESGRGYRPAKWAVYCPGFKTDPDAHWMDYGSKVFPLYDHTGTNKESKDAALTAAKQWAGERYGIKEWAKTPFGDWMDAEFVKTRMAELKLRPKTKII